MIALCSLGQTTYGSTIKLSDLPGLAPAPLGSDHPPLVLNASLRPSSEINNIAGSEISLPIGQIAHALMTLMTPVWLNLGPQPVPLAKAVSPSSSTSYADHIFPLNVTLTPGPQNPNILTSQAAGWAAIDLLSSILSLANPNDTTAKVPTSQIIFNKLLNAGTIAFQRGGGPTGDQALLAAHLICIDDARSSMANYSSEYDGYNIALDTFGSQIPAKTVIGLIFRLLMDLPLS
ncbi:MAG: hypothetical protein OHK93_003605 [Ramalina farinacea]|uniref:Uncharacterized protein n=1 Tax=Ramalina farinacea TaxID=258253 RepID=A0AA43TUT8_9LECA|nr:hypothetical protein [Ramalina farinacea]